jgi:AraC-like DNA-binding protein
MVAARPIAMQRVGPILGLADLLRERGIAPESVADSLGIDLTAMSVDRIAPFQVLVDALDRAARLLECPHVGLLVGARYVPAGHGTLYRLMRCAPTLRQALLDFAFWQPGYSSGAMVYLNRHGDDFAWGYAALNHASAGTRHVYDLSVAIGFNLVADLTAGAVGPEEVLFSHRVPDDIRLYERILKVPMRFNQGQTYLLIAGSAIDTPLPGADEKGYAAARREMEVLFPPLSASLESRVKRLIRPRLLTGDVSFEGLASAVGVRPRTFRRRLADEGVTFEKILEEVRFSVAQELLELTDMSITDLSAALGYSSQSSFQHAFRRWCDVPPAQWRRGIRDTAQVAAPP